MRDQLEEQLSRFHWAVRKGPDGFSKDKYKLSGKLGSLQDDLAVTTMMCMYWGRIATAERERRGIGI